MAVSGTVAPRARGSSSPAITRDGIACARARKGIGGCSHNVCAVKLSVLLYCRMQYCYGIPSRDLRKCIAKKTAARWRLYSYSLVNCLFTYARGAQSLSGRINSLRDTSRRRL